MQNTSHSVISQRTEPLDSPDDFPTPPWRPRLDRAHYRPRRRGGVDLPRTSMLSRTLAEYFAQVESADAFTYGFAEVRDFLQFPYEAASHDWVITNPPFKLAEEFVVRGLSVARRGVAILARTVFLEGSGRQRRIFVQTPPTVFAQFVERVPMVKGRLDRKASIATGYAWFLWEKGLAVSEPRLMWVPQCRKALELDADYSR